MNICNGSRDKHDEVVFEGNDCPMCGLLEMSNDFEKTLQVAQERIKELEALLTSPHTT
jgi:hypothetical protein